MEKKLLNLALNQLTLRYRILNWQLECFLFDIMGKISDLEKNLWIRDIFKENHVETTERKKSQGIGTKREKEG